MEYDSYFSNNRVSMIKTIGLAKNKKYNQGYYYPKNKNKYIGNNAIYRSGLELRYFQFLDNNPKCLKWNSEGITVPYFWEVDNKWHQYYIDLAATFQEKDKTQMYLIEIKPYRQTLLPQDSPKKRKKTLLTEQITFSQNQSKWKAASEFALKNGLKFIILTEKDLS